MAEKTVRIDYLSMPGRYFMPIKLTAFSRNVMMPQGEGNCIMIGMDQRMDQKKPDTQNHPSMHARGAVVPAPSAQFGFVGTRYGLSGSTLKLVACVTMLIDHTGAAVVNTMMSANRLRTTDPAMWQTLSSLYSKMRLVGRLAFPIFCFLIVEGFFHTRSVKNYCQRLFLFALVSEFPFDFALKASVPYWRKQNVYFTLLIGLLCLYLLEELRGMPWIQFFAVAASMYLSDALMTDYNFKGVFLIVMLYFFHDHRLYQSVVGAASIAWERFAPLSFVLCFFYNGKRGLRLRYFFYLFYPVHLVVLGIIKHLILRR